MESPQRPSMTLRSDGPSPFHRPPQSRPVSPANSAAPIATARPTTTPAARSIASASAVTAHGLAPVSMERLLLEARRRRSAYWFYWVAALSLVNSLAAWAGQHGRFIVGLGMTQVVDALGARAGRGHMVPLLFDLCLIGGFVLLGRSAVRGSRGAFLVGIGVYTLDGLIFLVVHDWMALGFHAFVLVMIVKGLQATRQLATDAAPLQPTRPASLG